ncbi:hypothetical protein GGF49_000753 [Coemansia sp. RSA 1853]|nr:hypothetical protein GGF49_000753 [Coemansia sp. RSA 1853]
MDDVTAATNVESIQVANSKCKSDYIDAISSNAEYSVFDIYLKELHDDTFSVLLTWDDEVLNVMTGYELHKKAK